MGVPERGRDGDWWGNWTASYTYPPALSSTFFASSIFGSADRGWRGPEQTTARTTPLVQIAGGRHLIKQALSIDGAGAQSIGTVSRIAKAPSGSVRIPLRSRLEGDWQPALEKSLKKGLRGGAANGMIW